MSDPVRIGIIGCGSVSREYFALLQRLSGKAVLTAACDADETREAYVRDHWGVSAFSTDYRELAQSENVDLALVLTPMPTHGEIARAFLEAGKHVLVEKPLATTLEEASRLVEMAKQSPGYLVCAPHVILSPTYQQIAQRLKSGDIGKVLTARARYGWSGPDWGQWFYRSGGGVLFDLGVYNLTTLTGLLGPAQRVLAATGTAIPERLVDGDWIQVEVEDNAQLILDFGDAVFASVLTGFTMQAYRSPAVELYGREGVIQMLGDDWSPQGYEIFRNAVGHWETITQEPAEWFWTDGLRHLVDCIQHGKRPQITPEHAYHVLEIMIRAQESGRDGEAKPLVSRF
jgi:predicted dehydrogenase